MPPLGLQSFLAKSTLCHTCRARLLRQAHAPRTSYRALTTTTRRPLEKLRNVSNQTNADPADAPPRWARTPQAMSAPYKARPANDNDDYPVNEDPARLDAALGRMLGPHFAVGRDGVMLDEEVKWLVVTHKSFDHGKRGMNDRLAFMGKRIVELQTSLALIDNPYKPTNSSFSSIPPPTRLEQPAPKSISKTRTPYSAPLVRPPPLQDPALHNLDTLNHRTKARLLDRIRLAQLAESYGLDDVIRWKPRQISNLKTSGLDVVLAQAVYAVVGAVALQKGGVAAAEVVRERVLKPLGVL